MVIFNFLSILHLVKFLFFSRLDHLLRAKVGPSHLCET